MSFKAVSVKVNDQNSARVRSISYENNINVKVESQQDYYVKSAGKTSQYLRDLRDVSILTSVDKDSLIFNGATGKYESRPINASDVILTNIDAGTF